MSENTKKSTRPNKKKWLVEQSLSLGFALLLVFMIRSSVVEAFKIPSGSMIPTLLIGDHIFVNKFAYGLKVPFSDLFLDDPIYLIKRDLPKSGDIIVFKYPGDESLYYIKRVIGTPGDTVEVRNKVLFINGKEQLRRKADAADVTKTFEYLKDSPQYRESSIEIFREKIGPTDHLMMTDRQQLFTENFGPRTVPADHFFVMGDNRDFSNDSRFWGFVPMRNIKGKAMIIWLSVWFSFSDSGLNSWKPHRIGTILN